MNHHAPARWQHHGQPCVERQATALASPLVGVKGTFLHAVRKTARRKPPPSPLLSSAIFYAREANVDPLVVDEADHKRTAALEAARQFDATPPPTAEGDAVGNQAAGAAAMHSGEGSRQWAA